MFSGKTEELLRRLMRAKRKGQTLRVFKPTVDTRYSSNEVVSHGGLRIEAETIQKLPKIDSTEIPQVIGIDEAQFFGTSALVEVQNYVALGARVILSGLDLTFQGQPFYPMPDLMAFAHKVTKLHAVCARCLGDATRTFRLASTPEVIENWTSGDIPLTPILVGGAESYEPRCVPCYYGT